MDWVITKAVFSRNWLFSNNNKLTARFHRVISTLPTTECLIHRLNTAAQEPIGPWSSFSWWSRGLYSLVRSTPTTSSSEWFLVESSLGCQPIFYSKNAIFHFSEESLKPAGCWSIFSGSSGRSFFPISTFWNYPFSGNERFNPRSFVMSRNWSRILKNFFSPTRSLLRREP